MTCASFNIFLDSPDSLSYILHAISILSTPIHFLGLYCILFKTPDNMKSVKWYLLNLHFWIVLFDYSVGLLIVPILLVPSLAGFPRGLLRDLGVPTLYQTLFIVALMAYVVASIVALFENRFHVVCKYPGKDCWRVLRRPWIVTHYIGIALVVISFAYFVPDQQLARQKVIQKIPCLPDFILREEIFVLSDDYTLHMAIFVFFAFLVILEISSSVGFLGFYTLRQLKNKTMSQKTFDIQKKFFMALVVQIKIPLVMIMVPLAYVLVSIFSDYYNQTFINLLVILASLHGICSTLVMLFVHHPYRKVILRAFVKNQTTQNVSEKEPTLRGGI